MPGAGIWLRAGDPGKYISHPYAGMFQVLWMRVRKSIKSIELYKTRDLYAVLTSRDSQSGANIECKRNGELINFHFLLGGPNTRTPDERSSHSDNPRICMTLADCRSCC